MKTTFAKFVGVLSIIAFFTAFAYFYPRFLVSTLGENNPWISYFYTYGMGFIFFSASLILIFTRSINSFRRRLEFYWLIVVSVGFLFMFFCHGLWIYSAIHFPIKS